MYVRREKLEGRRSPSVDYSGRLPRDGVPEMTACRPTLSAYFNLHWACLTPRPACYVLRPQIPRGASVAARRPAHISAESDAG